MRHLIFLVFLLSGLLTTLSAQVPTTQDCFGAVPVCSQIYRESTAPSGFGNYSNEIDPTISCVFDDNNAIWYTFTVNSSGNFGFILTPNDLNDDYDWALFNLTTASCEDISKNPELLVSCNAAGGGLCQGVTGANGNTRHDIQGGGCDANFPDLNMGQSPFNNFIPVQAGNTYSLMVSNWTGSTNGYEIDFGVSGDIGIIDRTPPEIKSVTLDRIDGCSPKEIVLEFSESIQCNSIALSNFQLVDSKGGQHDIMFSSPICDVGGEYSRTFLITLMEPLSKIDETYTLIGTPQEALKILDICDNESAIFQSDFEVTLPQLNDITLPADTVVCNVESIVLDVFDPVALSYAWRDGTTTSDFTISSSGTYFVTVTNTCEVKSTSIDVIIIPELNEVVDLGPDRNLCPGTSYIIDPKLDINYDYIWNDGNTNRIRNLAVAGTYSVTVTNECKTVGEDEITVTYDDRSLALEFEESMLLCTNEVIELSAEHPNATEYLWSDGSTSPTLTINTGGTYSATVTNECESAQGEIIIIESSCVECHVYVPNSFAPNNSTANGSLQVTSNCRLETYRIRVFDRWGAEVFISDDPNVSWQGFAGDNTQIASGVYVYVVRYSYFEFAELVEKVEYGDVLVIQ